MITTRYFLAAALTVGISMSLSSAYAATVVTYSSKPAYAVTTVRTANSYRGIYPAPCCYTRIVVTAPVAPAPVVVVPPPKPSARVVYMTPPVAVYPKVRVVYAPRPYYYVP